MKKNKHTKSVAVSENNKKFTVIAEQNSTIKKIRIDNNLIKSSTLRKCDWSIKVNPQIYEHIFYVELKGCDLMHAISQLENTIQVLNSDHSSYKNKEAHAVCSKVIPAIISSAQVKAVKFKKDYNFLLKWHSQSGTASCLKESK